MTLFDQYLPDEIGLKILKYLDYKSLLRTQQVNQKGYRLGYEQKRKLLKKITFYECNNNNESTKIYIRINQLKNLLIEAEGLRRKIYTVNVALGHQANFPALYQESEHSQLMKSLPEEQKIENILKQEKWIDDEYKILSIDPKTPLLKIMGILYISRKYEVKDEYIILQTPGLLKFLSDQDYNMIFKSKRTFDGDVCKVLMQNTDLVLTISPCFLEILVEIKEKEKIFKKYILPNQAIKSHLAQNNKLNQYMVCIEVKKDIRSIENIYLDDNDISSDTTEEYETDVTDEDLSLTEESEQFNFNALRLNQR